MNGAFAVGQAWAGRWDQEGTRLGFLEVEVHMRTIFCLVSTMEGVNSGTVALACQVRKAPWRDR